MIINNQHEFTQVTKELAYYERKLGEGQELIEAEKTRKLEIEEAINFWKINNGN